MWVTGKYEVHGGMSTVVVGGRQSSEPRGRIGQHTHQSPKQASFMIGMCECATLTEQHNIRKPILTCAVLLSDIFGLARPSPAKLQSVLAQRRATSTEVVLFAARAMIRTAPSSTVTGSR